MNLMLCLNGEPEQLAYLPEIAALGAGIELGGYGLKGVLSEQDWQERLELHQAVRSLFEGRLALHGPFLGMEFAQRDHLIRQAVQLRLNLTWQAALKLNASRVVLHSGCTPEVALFGLQEDWLRGNISFWQGEIGRWAEAGIEIVLENDTQDSPDLLVRLVEAVDHPNLGLCLDIGHQHVFSALDAPEWLRRMGKRLVHVHLHDNDGTRDNHLPLGEGSIPFDHFFEAVLELAPGATLSLEVEADMRVKMDNLRWLADFLAARGHH